MSSVCPFSCDAPETEDLTTISAPPVATPETTLIALPLDFSQELMAGFGPT